MFQCVIIFVQTDEDNSMLHGVMKYVLVVYWCIISYNVKYCRYICLQLDCIKKNIYLLSGYK